VHDEEKPFEMELAWICEASGREFRRVPAELAAAAERQAKASLADSDMCACPPARPAAPDRQGASSAAGQCRAATRLPRPVDLRPRPCCLLGCATLTPPPTTSLLLAHCCCVEPGV